MGTFVVGAILVLIVGLIVRGIVKDKKAVNHHVVVIAVIAGDAIDQRAAVII